MIKWSKAKMCHKCVTSPPKMCHKSVTVHKCVKYVSQPLYENVSKMCQKCVKQ